MSIAISIHAQRIFIRPLPYSDQELSAIFGKFANREVATTERTVRIKLRNLGIDETYTRINLRKNGRTLRELNAAVKAAGLELRVWTPLSAGTMDYVTTRLNVDVEKSADGKYRIGKNFRLG